MLDVLVGGFCWNARLSAYPLLTPCFPQSLLAAGCSLLIVNESAINL